MFKKGIVIVLSLLVGSGICVYAAKTARDNETPQSIAASESLCADDAVVSTTQTEQKTEPAQKKEAESTTEKNADKTQKKQGEKEKTTAEKKGSAADEAQHITTSAAMVGAQKTTKAPQPTTKKQSTTKTQSTAASSTTTAQTTTKEQTTIKDGFFITFTIDCTVAVGKADGVPASGYYLSGAKVNVAKDASVYEALSAVCSANGISLTATNTMYGMYVSAIGGLAEKEVGKYSGWKYMVNGVYPSKACDKIFLKEGDDVVFIYAKS